MAKLDQTKHVFAQNGRTRKRTRSEDEAEEKKRQKDYSSSGNVSSLGASEIEIMTQIDT